MLGRGVRAFACIFCFFFIDSSCMEEREHKDDDPKKFGSMRKNLLSSKKDSQKEPQRTQSTLLVEINSALGKLKQEIAFSSKSKKLSLNVPMIPYYFTSIEKVKDFIQDLESWGVSINYRFPENGKTVAHYAFDLNEFNLFQRSHHDKEIRESERKGIRETNIQFHSLPPEKYLALQYQFIVMLLSYKGIDLTIRDNNGETPFECFIKSLFPSSSKQEKDEAHLQAEAIYIPKIFDAIIRHGYNKQFKQDLYGKYKIDDPNLIEIKQRLSFFPIYENLTGVRTFISEKLPDLKGGINTRDTLGTTILHRIFHSIKDNVITYTGSIEDIVLIFRYICENYKPDFSIKNDHAETPIDCFFLSLLASEFGTESEDEKKHSTFASKTIKESSKEFESESESESESDIEESEVPSTIKKKLPLFQLNQDFCSIFKQITLLCPCEIVRESFIILSAKKRKKIASFISVFPIFIEIDDIEKRFEKETDILKTVDSEENNYLHYAVDFSKGYILMHDTLQNRLILIKLVLKNVPDFLIFKKNKNNKIPFQIFICSVPTNNVHKKTIRSILLKLAEKINTEERISIINLCNKERLTFLNNLLSGPYKSHERDLIRELLNAISFKLTGM